MALIAFAAALAAPAPVAIPPAPAAPPGRHASDPHAVGTEVLRRLLPQLDDIHACHRPAPGQSETPSGGDLVLSAIFDPSGKIDQVVISEAGAKLGAWKAERKTVAPCVKERVGVLELPRFADGYARKVVIAFRLPPGEGATVGKPAAPAPAAPLDTMELARDIVAGRAIGLGRAPARRLTYRQCWKNQDGPEDGPEDNRCRVLLAGAPLPPGRGERDPAAALADAFAKDPPARLGSVSWPDDAAAVVLPDIGLALSAVAGHIDIARASPEGEELPTPRLDLRGGRAAHLVAVHWRAGQPVVVLTTRRHHTPQVGDPPGAATIEDLEVIDLAH